MNHHATHPEILGSRALRWPDERACAEAAAALAAVPSVRQAQVNLHGDLGAGKTTFVRHLLRALGVGGRIKSPSYALVETYDLPGGGSATHCDFYRFGDPREWEDAGLRDLFAAPALKLVEWPEQAGALLPTADLALRLTALDEQRRTVVADAHSPRGLALLEALA
ncbi:tRNA (adenosine(37)-N6)-threonylcarbamoyltransferase complex ATPase subunit type 1 TsaE [Aquabacterium sp. J223]|uniref:tRNA (adenosine(37)-N6)-threonylcarbamoyltransferase complex ATPase subunit type 1 TsaE n=1 Tax=Aquabacterium sp. J223 TaxID=2898431 RepID=UPI0021ADFB8A|nr:tRNA (adenosine(37)-N6)-threonylcarbamoyltransferase complex ATPase subunit type 1 TsaE [Aquabacterium sp. J223]UUX94029.1 tRNA (adenosine(37)-N6)-threonylcarbamoyltransferase complex ATPase subunit type 1 TsaE [Aquabacterium sp. J223]